MGTVPESTLWADLNGDGELIDITDFVDDSIGIAYEWGRTDWSASEPNAGQLTFTLDNTDGRFTPGNTATYDVGVIDGVSVKWITTAGDTTRTRWFKMGTPTVAFPSGSAVSSQVTVTCYDAVGFAGSTVLRSMLDEEVMLTSPAAYWRLDESGVGLAVRPADTSGRVAASLVPHGAAESFGWADGQGPAADDGGALHLSGDLAVPSKVGPYLVTARPIPDVVDVDGGSGFTFQMWFTVRNIYRGLAASDVVHLCTLTSGSAWLQAYWSPYRGTVTLASSGNVAFDVGPAAAGRTHLLQVAASLNPVNHQWEVHAVVDALTPQKNILLFEPQTTDLSVRLGSDPTAAYYAHAGTVARVALSPGSDAFGSSRFWEVGQLGSPEAPAVRAANLARYRGLTIAAEGTDRGDLVGRQDTRGQSLLSAICDALRTEDAALDSTDTADALRPWLYSTQRPSSLGVSIDVEEDGQGTPELSFDTSAVASTVTVSSPTVSATWTIRDPGRWPNTETFVPAALSEVATARNLAQYRALLGRITQAVPSLVTVDVASSENDITAALLESRPGELVRVDGFRQAIMGYTTAAAYVIGGTELHTEQTAIIALRLMPIRGDVAPWRLYDGVAVSARGQLQASPGNVLAADCDVDDTDLQVVEPDGSPFLLPYGSGERYTIRIGDEYIGVTGRFPGHLFVIRGALSTAPSPHSAGDPITIVGTGTLEY